MSSPLEPTLPPGTLVDGRYRIVAPLGSGGMATVYRAEHLGMGREVALKVLDTGSAPAAFAQRFEREARAVARLDHPGCVRVFDYGRSFGRHYLAMELIEGRNLADETAKAGRLPVALAVQLVRQLLDALEHAHARGVLHRDIKPPNAMLVSRGGAQRLVLIDFGLARVEDEAPLTAAGICAGSPSYIPPERLAGAPYGERADLWAVGVTLYELIAGRRPFLGESPKDITRQTLYEAPPPLRDFAPHVSPELEAVVTRALSKEPSERFADAREMAEALRACQAPWVPAPSTAAGAAPGSGAADETTYLEVDFIRPTLWERIVGWLRPAAARPPLEITSVG